MSSSAIGFQQITYGPTGATGPVGATGLIGPTGGTSGSTGIRGPYSAHIQNITVSGSTATVILSDGREFEISGSFFGNTGIDYTQITITDPLNPSVDDTTYSLLASGNNTSSFVMRGISAYGSLYVTEDSEAIYIDSIYGLTSGSLDSTGLLDNTLVYLKKRNQISSTTIGITSGAFYTGVLNFEKSNSTTANPSFSKLLPRAKTKYISPTFKTSSSQPITLNVNDAGIFYVRTPNGITSFNGSFNDNEIVSFTLIFESDDIWHFPSNVYFQNGENYLTCGKSVVNLTSFDKGNSWYAVVSARGIDVNTDSCELRSLFGSCCYSGPTGTMCIDYASKAQCDILSGTFNPLQSCETSCGFTFGICCSNGQCVENTSYSECLAFGGKFLFGVTCGSFGADPSGDNSQRLCYDKCLNQKVACCKDGICLGDEFTKIECEQILQGTAFVGTACSEVDCCEQNVKIGACCENQTCSQKTLLECKDSGGVFMGEGENCLDVNCECFGDPKPETFGFCCYCNGTTPACKISTKTACDGIWTEDLTLTQAGVCNGSQLSTICLSDSNFNCTSGTGQCCYCEDGITTCVSAATQQQCNNLQGNFTLGGQCNSSCDPCTSSNGGPCGDCSSGECNTIVNDTSLVLGCQDEQINCNYQLSSTRTTVNEKFSKNQTIIASDNKNIIVENNYGFLVKDYFIDVNDLQQCGNNGEDLQFCLTVQFDDTETQGKSLRMYLLRTWYPKFFAQNYAHALGLTYEPFGSAVPLQPSSETRRTSEEYHYWNDIPERKSRYIRIPYFILPGGLDAFGQGVNYNTDNLIEELNCPLYGLNPRGKGLLDLDPQGVDAYYDYIPSPNLDAPENRYLSNNEYQDSEYYRSSNIGIGFTPVLGDSEIGNLDGSSTLPSILYPYEIDKGRFIRANNSTGINSFLFISKGLNKIKKSVEYPFESGTYYDFLSFIGYNDIGQKFTYLNNSITYIKEEPGFYAQNAIINRFSNIFQNGNRYILDGAEGVNRNYAISGGEIFPGHPLTVDFEAEYEKITNQFGSSFKITLPNSTLKGGLYKTKPTAILLDTGVITNKGKYIPDVSYDSFERLGDNVQVGSFGHLGGYNSADANNSANNYFQKTYYGALNNPELSEPDRAYAETVGTYLGNGKYNFCIKLKNYKDNYLLTEEGATDTNLSLLYDGSGTELDRAQRFKQFINKLRLVVFSSAHEDTSKELNLGYADGQPGNPFDFNLHNLNFTAQDSAIPVNIFNNYLNSTIPDNGYKINFSCSGNQCNTCDTSTGIECPLCVNKNNTQENGLLKTNCLLLISRDALVDYFEPFAGLEYSKCSRSNYGNFGTFQCCGCNCGITEEILGHGYFCNSDGDPDLGCACKYQNMKFKFVAPGAFGGCGLGNECTDCGSGANLIRILRQSNLIYGIHYTCDSTSFLPPQNQTTMLGELEGFSEQAIGEQFGCNVYSFRMFRDIENNTVYLPNSGIYGIPLSLIQSINRKQLIEGCDVGINSVSTDAKLRPFNCSQREDTIRNRCISSTQNCTSVEEGTNPFTNFFNWVTANGVNCKFDEPEWEHGIVEYANCDNYPLNVMGNPCELPLSGASWLTNTKNKKLYISDTEFVCVTIDCTVEDCDQYEDCSI